MDLNSFTKNYTNVVRQSFQREKIKPSSLSKCLKSIEQDWTKNQNITSLWKNWPRIVGEDLSANCIPLTFQKGILTIGVWHPQWIQAVMFNRNQLIAALGAEGHNVKDLRIKNYYPPKQRAIKDEKNIWNEHPSRYDVHGKKSCPICHHSTPAGEITLWGKCSLCRRVDLSK